MVLNEGLRMGAVSSVEKARTLRSSGIRILYSWQAIYTCMANRSTEVTTPSGLSLPVIRSLI